MSWNNIIQKAQWDGNSNINYRKLNISSIIANTISTNYLNANFISSKHITYDVMNGNEINTSTIYSSNIFGYNNYLDYIKNINIQTDVITLDEQGLTATVGGLYLNGNLIGSPSTISSISDWSKFKAETNVNMANSTIRNANGISSLFISTGNMDANIINCDTVRAIGGRIDTLFGFDQINYPKGKIDVLSNLELRTSSIYVNDITSEQIYNKFEISSYSVYADLGVFNTLNTTFLNLQTLNAVNGTFSNKLYVDNKIYANNISSGTLTVGDYIDTVELNATTINSLNIGNANQIQTDTFYANGGLISTLIITQIATVSTFRANNISSFGISSQQIYTDLATVSSLRVNNVSTGNISVSSINTSNGIFDNIYANNIYNNCNINTSNLVVSNGAAFNNTNTSGAATFTGGVNGNCDFTFQTNSIPIFGNQYLRDINKVRNITVEKITILGGATGNTLPPYYNDSILEIGNDIDQPGQVIINGFNPDPLDVGVALTVRGDTQITQNLNVLGLTTLEGVVETIGDLNVDGGLTVQGTADVTGLLTTQGDINALGALTVEGETNLLGAVTAEAGIGIAGALGVTGGDITFGSEIDTGNLFTNYGGTLLSNGLTLYGSGYFNDTQLAFIKNGSTIGAIDGVSEDNLIIGAVNDLKLLAYSTISLTAEKDIIIASSNDMTLLTLSNMNVTALNNMIVGCSNNLTIVGQEQIDISSNKINIYNTINLNQKNISSINEIQVNNSFYSIPDSVDYILFRRWYNWFSYSNVGDPDFTPLASDWAYFNAKSNVDLNYYSITNAQDLYVNNNFIYSNIVQPIIQCGNGNTGSSGTTITLPVAYPTSNYCVQLTYHDHPSVNKPLYHTSVTDSNFSVDGDANADFDWTTFYVP